MKATGSSAPASKAPVCLLVSTTRTAEGYFSSRVWSTESKSTIEGTPSGCRCRVTEAAGLGAGVLGGEDLAAPPTLDRGQPANLVAPRSRHRVDALGAAGVRAGIVSRWPDLVR